mmetsp:Transcript_5179/g.9034  ORF Transcript_5179/g.9034 Transcript_5179/m.9034 type:complete len:944 (-) Transcript_5179:1287-4118(-)
MKSMMSFQLGFVFQPLFNSFSLSHSPTKCSHVAQHQSTFIPIQKQFISCMISKIRVNQSNQNSVSVIKASIASPELNTDDEISQIMDQSGWFVHKFGGSSLADAERIANVATLIQKEYKAGRKLFVVLSAVYGVTNKLISMVETAAGRDKERHFLEGIEELRDMHEVIAERLLPVEARGPFLASLNADLRDLRDLLRAVWIARTASENLKEMIAGYGEMWSTQLVWSKLRSSTTTFSCSWMDARDVLVVRRPNMNQGSSGSGLPRRLLNWQKSQSRLDGWIKANPTDVVVCTGFIASDEDGVGTTLGRNGSDYSAACFAKLLQAKVCEIWTDVDGVYSADPRQVPDALVIRSLSYKEASELAYFGAKVLHPDSMTPLVNDSIPMRIRNSFRPQAEGTLVRAEQKLSEKLVKVLDSSVGVKGFSTMQNVALVNVEGAGMIGVPGIAGRMFTALYNSNISCILIAQASSEYSICAAVPRDAADTAKAAIENAFRFELAEKLIAAVNVERDVSILAVVGENMARIPGVCARLFDSLLNAGINVMAMAQGSSERNISVVLRAEDETRALRAVHAAFYLSRLTLAVGVIGPGVVGSVLINQLKEQREFLRKEFGVDLQVRAITTSRKMLISGTDDAIDLDSWKQEFDSRAQDADIEKFAAHLKSSSMHSVICDCTASPIISDYYESWLTSGLHIVTPNKKANSSSMEQYNALRVAMKQGNRSHFFYEANVGAGLPIISTIRDLLRTGDRFLEIQGIFSGTLSYIFNEFDGSEPFSSIVNRAKQNGFTEPDPREDLSGMDVARKVVILAREVGLDVELEDVPVASLVPEALAGSDVSIDQFMERLPEFDDNLSVAASEAAASGEKLRYVGVVNVAERKCAVELRRYPETHSFGSLKGSDNIILFRTVRYDAQPLTIRGPGAGADVTAAGVFADVLRLAAYLGAPSAAES